MHIRSFLISSLLTTAAAAQGFGAVFIQSNDPTGNEVRVALRTPAGQLVPAGSYATGGAGTGTGLGSQGALATTRGGDLLFAVNAGSDDVTMFRVLGGFALWRLDTEASGGDRPTSVAVHGRFVYVLNAGSDSLRGFRRRGSDLEPIPGADYPLSQAGAAGAQVDFSPDGDFLVVTERATNRIGVFPVRRDGTLGAGSFQPSAGATPFGFLFRDDGTLVVSEAAGGMPGASVASSYRILPGGQLDVVAGAVATNQTAACWVAIPKGGAFAYTTNTADGTVTGFGLDSAGGLGLLDPSGVSGDLGAAARPIDFAFTKNGHTLYVLDSAADEVRAFHRQADGSLVLLAGSWPLGDGAAGLLAR